MRAVRIVRRARKMPARAVPVLQRVRPARLALIHLQVQRVVRLVQRVPRNGNLLRPVVPLVGQAVIHPQGLRVVQRVQQEPMALRPVLVVVRIVPRVPKTRVWAVLHRLPVQPARLAAIPQLGQVAVRLVP